LWDSDARGVFFGLTLSTTAADLLRAILEGTAFSVLHNIEQFEQAGASIGSLVCAGGGSRSKLWNQIISSACDREVITIPNEDNVTLGNMLLAACAMGVYSDLDEAARAIMKQKMKFAPVPLDTICYRGLFQIYKHLYGSLRESFTLQSEWLKGMM
jgi:xylulokinase